METRSLYLADNASTTSNPVEVTNSATGEVIGRVGTIDRQRMRGVLADAEAAWGNWRRLTGKQRGLFLKQLS